MLAFVAVLACAVSCISQVSAQAPGDYDHDCRTGNNVRTIPAERKILVDTHDYSNLYDQNSANPAWAINDVDGDSLNWQQFVGGACSWAIRSCTNQASQDNWLLSQYISYGGAVEILFETTFRFSECLDRSFCTKPYMTLYAYNRDNIASEADRIDPNNYQPLLGSAESSRLEQPANSRSQVSETLRLPRPVDSNGFYLGVRDEGTCGNVVRLTVYYVVCPARQEGLVSYPEFAVPVRGSSDVIFDANCVADASNITTLQVTAFSDSSSCSPVASGGAVCRCNEGYVVSQDGMSCEACSAGTYRSFNNATCQPCPENTMTDVVGASECSCIEGFYRSTSPHEEGPGIGCTSPPGACTDIVVTARTATSLTVEWSSPVDTGLRGDLFYRVWRSNPDAIGEFVVVDNVTTDVMYEVMDLKSFTSYIVRVTTHNGVSDQDPQNSHLRQCEVSDMTLEGIPGMPDNVEGLCTVIVWQSPSEPNGNILRYEIEFTSDNPESQLPADHVVSRGANDVFYLTSPEERRSGTEIRVRAINGAGGGVWSAYEDVGCSGESTCPILEPSNPSTTCPPALSALRFELGGTTYLNNTVVMLEDIGEGEGALLCVTDNTECCIGTLRQGDFYYPDESQVQTAGSNDDIYRNRGSQFIRLNRRNGATSPTGRYRCEIPDASGTLQNIFIIVVTTPTCETCPTCPTTTCPTCPSVTIPPTPACPTTPPPQICATCPEVTCPTTSPPTECTECPTQDTSSPQSEPALRFELGGTTYLNNTVVVLEDIGEGEGALLCVTDNTECCIGTLRQGEFYYPDESQVQTAGSNDDIYRNRGSQFIRLNRRNGATSPTGRYRCEIPDASGTLQNIFIVVVTTLTCETCPTCPTITCPTCPSVTIPPTPVCPTTRPPQICATCPEVTCPTTSPPTECTECPTQDTSSPQSEPALRFELGGTTYLNNTVVVMEDIGEGEGALLCVTDNTECCIGTLRQGEFYYPHGSQVRTAGSNDDIYRNRGSQFIRLNRRNGAISPTGRFRCEIPDFRGTLQNIFITLVSTSCSVSESPTVSCPTCSPSTCPDPCEDCSTDCPEQIECPDVPCPTVTDEVPLGVIDIIETTSSFIAALTSPATTESVKLQFKGTSETRKQVVTVDIKTIPGKYLIEIQKQILRGKLSRGSSYVIKVENSIRESSYIFEYREDIPDTAGPSDGESCDMVTYVVITAIVVFLLTAIVSGIILALVVYCLTKKKKNSKTLKSTYTEKNSYFSTNNSETKI